MSVVIYIKCVEKFSPHDQYVLRVTLERCCKGWNLLLSFFDFRHRDQMMSYIRIPY
jgi:hypothetical protein